MLQPPLPLGKLTLPHVMARLKRIETSGKLSTCLGESDIVKLSKASLSEGYLYTIFSNRYGEISGSTDAFFWSCASNFWPHHIHQKGNHPMGLAVAFHEQPSA